MRNRWTENCTDHKWTSPWIVNKWAHLFIQHPAQETEHYQHPRNHPSCPLPPNILHQCNHCLDFWYSYPVFSLNSLVPCRVCFFSHDVLPRWQSLGGEIGCPSLAHESVIRNTLSFDCPSEGDRVVAFARLGGCINLGPARSRHQDGSRHPRNWLKEIPVKGKGESEQE